MYKHLQNELARVAPGWNIEQTGGGVIVLFKDFPAINASDASGDLLVCVTISPEVACIHWDNLNEHMKKPLSYADYLNGAEQYFTGEFQEVILEENEEMGGDHCGLLNLDQMKEIVKVRQALRDSFS